MSEEVCDYCGGPLDEEARERASASTQVVSSAHWRQDMGIPGGVVPAYYCTPCRTDPEHLDAMSEEEHRENRERYMRRVRERAAAFGAPVEQKPKDEPRRITRIKPEGELRWAHDTKGAPITRTKTGGPLMSERAYQQQRKRGKRKQEE